MLRSGEDQIVILGFIWMLIFKMKPEQLIEQFALEITGF